MNFRELCKIACVFIFLMSIQGNALAATIHGTVYEWYSFKPLENSIVEINSTPEQSYVAINAEYSFNLTPGDYMITANYLEEDTVVYTVKENVTISDEGEYVRDLLLFPTYQQDLLNQEDFENVDLDIEKQEAQSSQASSQNTVLVFALLALCFLLLAGYLVIKEKRKTPKAADFAGRIQNPGASKSSASESDISGPEDFIIGTKISGTKISEYQEPNEADLIKKVSVTNYEPSGSYIVRENTSETQIPVQQGVKLPADSKISISSLSEERPCSFSSETPENPEASLPDDLKEIMNLIRANGNRITQRELRKKSPYSESKVSLMLSDLEERGLVEKFKRGRGNIIRIPDGEALKRGGFQERNE